MTIELRQLDEENYEECLGLSVREDQPFVASNSKSLVQASFHEDAVPRAIYVDNVMVGFLMYIVDRGSGELYLWRFMVDQRHQGRGHGRAALDYLERIARSEPGIVRMKLSTSPENLRGIRIYTSFGFVDTGLIDHDEKILVKELR